MNDETLRRELDQARPEDFLEVLVAVARPRPMPRMPRLYPEARATPANQGRMAERIALFNDERQLRLQSQQPIVDRIQAQGGEVLDQYTLGNVIRARMPAAAVSALATDTRVNSLGSVRALVVPPQPNNNSDPNDDLGQARGHVNTDIYFNAGYTGFVSGQFVGIIDTGVVTTHSTLSNTGPPHFVDFRRDCVFGGQYCENTGHPNFDTGDSCWHHGSNTATAITANSNLGSQYRGVSGATVDSWKVYPETCDPSQRLQPPFPPCCNGSTPAILRAYDAAVAMGDDILALEVEALADQYSATSLAADDAFDAGAMVIAAAGNSGPGASSIAASGNAHKTIAVGAYEVTNLITTIEQSRGPTSDGRIKPDLQMPTNYELNHPCYAPPCFCGNECFTRYGGTSGATAIAAGAAAVFRDFYLEQGFPTSPGTLYAGLLAFGSRPYQQNNDEGTGRTHLGKHNNCSRWITGAPKIILHQSWADIQFQPSTFLSSESDLRVAIWWPEEPWTCEVACPEYHNDIDVYVYDPSWNLRAYGVDAGSVFEMTHVPGTLVGGTWTIRIYGYSLDTFAQSVHYLVHTTVHNAFGCP